MVEAAAVEADTAAAAARLRLGVEAGVWAEGGAVGGAVAGAGRQLVAAHRAPPAPQHALNM